jgi:hypothetical protein
LDLLKVGAWVLATLFGGAVWIAAFALLVG